MNGNAYLHAWCDIHRALGENVYVEDVKAGRAEHATAPTRQQREIATSIIDHQQVLISSGHGLGKTHEFPRMGAAYLLTHENCNVIFTGASGNALKRTLWVRHVEPMFDALKKHRDFKGKVGKLITFEWRIRKGSGLYCIASNERTKYQGGHNQNVFVIIDEATGIEDWKYQALRSIVNAPHKRIIAAANPYMSENGQVGEWWHQAWHEKTWHNIQLDANDHVNIREKTIFYPAMATYESIQKLADEFGIDSPLYKIMVKGDPPDAATERVIPRKFIDLAIQKRPNPKNKWQPAGGADISGEGSDLDVVVTCKNWLLEVKYQGAGDPTDAGIVQTIHDIITDHNLQQIAVDHGGIGHFVAPSLENRGFQQQVFRFNFGSKSMRQVVQERRAKMFEGPEHIKENIKNDFPHKDKITEAWFLLRRALQWSATQPDHAGVGIVEHNDLVKQLAARRFTVDPKTKKVMLVQKKKDTEKSPDHADACVMAFWAFCLANDVMSKFLVWDKQL